MAVDFEREATFGETVANRQLKRPGRVTSGLLLAIAVGVLGFAFYVNYLKPPTEEKIQTDDEFRLKKSDLDLSVDPPAEPEDNRLVVAPPPPEPSPVEPPVVQAVQPIDDGAAQRAAAEAERLRLEAERKRQERLQSNMIVIDDARPANGTLDQGSDGDDAGDGAQEEDANRRFVQNTSNQDVQKVKATQNHRIDALVPQGTMIRGVLETAVQSDLPGMVRAVISSDIYSFDGRRILLPKGTMLTGEYRSGLARGQTRVLIVWTRALRADGTSVALGSYGTDDLGRSGVGGVVDKHYLERFGSAAVLSLVGGVSAYVAGLSSNGSSNSNDGATQAQQAISQTISDMANQALADSIKIPPTVHVDQGTQIMVFVRRDLDFSSLYPDPVKEALRELRHPKFQTISK